MKDFILNHNLLDPNLIEVFRVKDNQCLGSLQSLRGAFTASNIKGISKPFPDIDSALQWLNSIYTTKPGADKAVLINQAVFNYRTALYSRANTTPGMIKEFQKRMEAASIEEIEDTILRLKNAIRNNNKRLQNRY